MTFGCMRFARPVSELQLSSKMYCRGLGLQQIGAFDDHHGFSGVMLGRDDLPWHLEFTFCHKHPVSPAPSVEDLLVLYFSDEPEWDIACKRMLDAGFSACRAFNPYWEVNGRTFVDHDGYRTVIQRQAWPQSSSGKDAAWKPSIA